MRYSFSTEAGTLPRSLTLNPVRRAHPRTSALLGEPADSPASASTARAPVLGFVAADRFLLFTVLFWPAFSPPALHWRPRRRLRTPPREPHRVLKGFAGVNGEFHSTPFDMSRNATHVRQLLRALRLRPLEA